MYAFFTLIAGACQSAMASLNGMLTEHLGMFGMSLMVHAIGGILLILPDFLESSLLQVPVIVSAFLVFLL